MSKNYYHEYNNIWKQLCLDRRNGSIASHHPSFKYYLKFLQYIHGSLRRVEL